MNCNQQKKFEPLVSIVIPVYNGSNYLREAIDSALAQTYNNTEVIVINDGSNDDGSTERIALEYGDRIRYFFKPNGGVSSALNYGIQVMNGEYFSWLSHDDVYNSQKIEKEVEALSKARSKYDLVLCKTEYIDKDSNSIKSKRKKQGQAAEYITDVEALLHLFEKGTFNGCAFLISKCAFEKCGVFNEDYRFNQDGLMWAKMFLNRISIISIPYIGVKSRIHNGQLTRKGLSLFHEECERMSGELLPRLSEFTNKEYRLVYAYAKYNAKHRNDAVVKKTIRESNKEDLTVFERIVVRLYIVYGVIRSLAKKIYYKMFRKIDVRG